MKRKVWFFAVLFLFLFSIGITSSHAAPGDFDATFSADGVVTYNGSANSFDSGSGVAVQPDGKIVVVARSHNGSNYDALVLRYNADGTPDSTFGAGGAVTYNGSANSDDNGSGVAVQPDGKIVVVARSHNGSNYDALVLRYNADGSPDTTFSTDGAVTFNGSANSGDYGSGVAIQPDGKIVVAGGSWNGSNDDALVLRYNADGTPDSTFSTDGVVTFNGSANSTDYGYGVAVQPDGKIVVVGLSHNGSNYDASVLRYNADGTPDSTFSTDGVVTFNGSANSTDYGSGVAVQPDGKIVVVGLSHNGSNYDALVLRYNADGTPDSTFSTDGVVTFNGSANSDDNGNGVAVQPDGKIVVVGDSWNGSNYDALVLRYNADGTPDSTFSTDGVVTFNGSANSGDYGNGVSVQPDGKIVVAGSSYNGANNDALILRLIGKNYSSPKIVTPNGGEDIPSGSTYPVWWGAPANAVNFKFKYSLDGGLTWKPMAAGVTGLPPYLWNVPVPAKNKKKCLAKVIGYNVSNVKIGADKSNAPFTIEVVKLTSPNGGETWSNSTSPHTITWTTNATKSTVTEVKLYYTLNNGTTWKTIDMGTDTSDDGSFDWTVPGVTSAKTKCKVKVVLKDSSGNLGSDVSDAVFTISP